MSPGAVCGCGVVDCGHYKDRSPSSSSSGIGSMGLYDAAAAASLVSSARPALSVPSQKCKYCWF